MGGERRAVTAALAGGPLRAAPGPDSAGTAHPLLASSQQPLTRRFGRLRDAVRAALDAATPPENVRDLVRQLREVVVEASAAVPELRAELARTDAALAVERRQLAEAERRGRLARDVQDRETADIAARFAAKHAEEVSRLERKAERGRDAVARAEADLLELRGELRRAERSGPATAAERSAERAWRALRAAGGAHPGADPAGALRDAALRRSGDEVAAEQQLRQLKRQMKKD